MKRSRSAGVMIILQLLCCFIHAASAQQRSQQGDKTAYYRLRVGISFAAAQQDAAQIGGYGAGGGLSFTLFHVTERSLVLTAESSIISLNDEYFRVREESAFLMPALKAGLGYALVRRHNLVLYPDIGMHCFWGMRNTETGSGLEVSERYFHAGVCAGISAVVRLRSPLSVYLSYDQRFDIITGDPQPMDYRVVRAGVMF